MFCSSRIKKGIASYWYMRLAFERMSKTRNSDQLNMETKIGTGLKEILVTLLSARLSAVFKIS